MKLPARQSDPKPVPNFKKLLRKNVRLARKTAPFSSRAIDLLASITREFQFSFKAGELQIINGNWYVTHTGLLRLICSVEEIGTIPNPAEKLPPQNAIGNGHGAGPKVRDRLCQIIRQHQLDPERVKAYAQDFCGTKTLRKTSREQVENFVQQLVERAAKDHNALLGQLQSYSQPVQEGTA